MTGRSARDQHTSERVHAEHVHLDGSGGVTVRMNVRMRVRVRISA